MSTYPAQVWDQLRNLTCEDLCKALQKDGWVEDMAGGSIRIYLNATTRARVDVHWHPKKTYGPKMLKGLLADTGWTVDDLRRLKLIK